MNPIRALAWFKLGGILAMLFIAAFVAYYIMRRGTLGTVTEAANFVKEKTPLGAPARAIDAGISKATQREETLGGWLAELFDPSTRAVNEMLKPATKPVFAPTTERNF